MQEIKEQSFGVMPVIRQDDDYLFLFVRHAGGHWGTPKGHANEGESPIETAKRELHEETGIDKCEILKDVNFEIVYPVDKNGETVNKKVTFFLCFVNNQDVAIPEKFKKEIVDFRWVNYGEALELVTHKESQSIITEAFNYLKNKK